VRVLQDLNETSRVLCNSTQTFLASHSCVLPLRLDPDEMASYMDCVEKWLAESQNLHQKCDEAHDNTTRHEQRVKELQQNHTLRKCTLATLRSNACGTYTACRDEHDTDYAQLVEEVVKSASGREVEVQTLTKITCFLEVVVMTPEELATEEGQTSLSRCETEVNSSLNLSFDFPSIPQATACPLAEVLGLAYRPGNVVENCANYVASPCGRAKGCDGKYFMYGDRDYWRCRCTTDNLECPENDRFAGRISQISIRAYRIVQN